jgi:hypothetical protein
MTSTDVPKEIDEEARQFCSFVATGSQESFQPIFVCHSCCSDETLHCVCQACADECHGKHEGLEYIGVGPCYCDCHELGCCEIRDVSKRKADYLGILQGSCCSKSEDLQLHQCSSSFAHRVYQIGLLDDPTIREKLLNQATELVKYSKDTFWIDESCFADGASLCDLERFAWIIYQHHKAESRWQETKQSGAEWWVQIKQFSNSVSTRTNTDEAIDLHYDKDEELAANFSLGAFPALSTVTYLTESQDMTPTIVFSRRYEDDDEAPISEMLVSHPKLQKHLAFEGNLLHGVPSHHLLRKKSPSSVDKKISEQNDLRITFLVNIWITHKPLNVQVLPDEIRENIKMCANIVADAPTITMENARIEKCSPIPSMHVNSIEQLPKDHRCRIGLPFVGGQATWMIDDDEDCEPVVLSTFPPPIHEGDNVLVTFSPELNAFLQSTS